MVDTSPISIELISSEQRDIVIPGLIKLLQDAVASDASIGFLPPFTDEEARHYWDGILDDVAQKSRFLLIAWDGREVAGSVQLELPWKPNARHRAEVQKLLVLQSQRRRGIGRRLLQAIEQVACEHGRTLLVLDTVQGSVAEQLYRQEGYIEAGPVPFYASNAQGTLDTTVIFYKLL